jgi:ABC-type Fe3+ transport system permease subunit
MKKIIGDGLIGIVAALLAMALFGGFIGYFWGLMLDGPEVNYGWDGAFGTIVLMTVFYGPYVAVLGMLCGVAIGWSVRKLGDRSRGHLP